MAYTAFTKSNVSAFRSELEAAITALAEKHGMTSRVGNIKYESGMITAPLTIRIDGIDSATDVRNSRKLGFDQNIVGKMVMVNGKKERISGLKPNNKLSVLTERYRLSPSYVKANIIND